MQVNIYLNDINIEDFCLDKFCVNPILFTNLFKEYLEKKVSVFFLPNNSSYKKQCTTNTCKKH